MADKIPISISVLDPSISTDGNRIDYKLTGEDKIGSFNVRRKFN